MTSAEIGVQGELLQDWTDYNKSLLHSISTEYYRAKGVEAFNHAHGRSIPNSVSSSYPHALAIVKILKTKMQDNQGKLRILECGSGAGLFARHFLLAAKEEGIISQIEYFLSDIAPFSLRQIQERGILAEFEGLGIVNFVTLSLPYLDSVLDLEGRQVFLSDLDLVINNYVIDALPMIPLRTTEKEGEFEKLQLKISSNMRSEAIDLVHNLDFIASLDIQERWVNYDITSATDLEQAYFDILKIFAMKYPPHAELRFSYMILRFIHEIQKYLKEDGLFYIHDIPSSVQPQGKHYCFFANAVANLLNEELIAEFSQALGMKVLYKQDHLHVNLLLVNSQNVAAPLREAFTKYFHQTCNMNLYHELIQMINIVQSPQSLDVLKFLVEKFQEIDGKSALSLTAMGHYLEATGNYPEALDIYLRARPVDFLNECLLEPKIQRLEAILKTELAFN